MGLRALRGPGPLLNCVRDVCLAVTHRPLCDSTVPTRPLSYRLPCIFTGTDAGKFGDPMRYPPISVHESAEDGVSKDAELGGLGFQVTPYLSIYSSI